MPKTLALPVRNYRMYCDAHPYGSNESDFGLVESTLQMPKDATALVLVDCWSMSYCPSWIARAEDVMRDCIVPVLEAARKAGLTIVHAPSPDVAAHYAQSTQFTVPGDTPKYPRYAEHELDWPPKDFIEREGVYEQFRRDSAIPSKYWAKKYEAMRINEMVAPRENELVISTGIQMHRALKAKQILHLVYAGFAANMCVQYRDYGMRAFNDRGYNCILLSDCTTGVEYHDTLEGKWATHLAIRETEYYFGYSMVSGDFIAACNKPAAK